MISRSTRKGWACLMLAVVLFAQGALALAACTWLQRAPALAVAHANQPTGEPCAMLEQSRNLCVAHCLGEDQSLDKPSIAMPALAAAPALALRAIALKRHHLAHAADLIPTAIGPPLHIRFQSFLL